MVMHPRDTAEQIMLSSAHVDFVNELIWEVFINLVAESLSGRCAMALRAMADRSIDVSRLDAHTRVQCRVARQVVGDFRLLERVKHHLLLSAYSNPAYHHLVRDIRANIHHIMRVDGASQGDSLRVWDGGQSEALYKRLTEVAAWDEARLNAALRGRQSASADDATAQPVSVTLAQPAQAVVMQTPILRIICDGIAIVFHEKYQRCLNLFVHLPYDLPSAISPLANVRPSSKALSEALAFTDMAAVATLYPRAYQSLVRAPAPSADDVPSNQALWYVALLSEQDASVLRQQVFSPATPKSPYWMLEHLSGVIEPILLKTSVDAPLTRAQVKMYLKTVLFVIEYAEQHNNFQAQQQAWLKHVLLFGQAEVRELLLGDAADFAPERRRLCELLNLPLSHRDNIKLDMKALTADCVHGLLLRVTVFEADEITDLMRCLYDLHKQLLRSIASGCFQHSHQDVYFSCRLAALLASQPLSRGKLASLPRQPKNKLVDLLLWPEVFWSVKAGFEQLDILKDYPQLEASPGFILSLVKVIANKYEPNVYKDWFVYYLQKHDAARRRLLVCLGQKEYQAIKVRAVKDEVFQLLLRPMSQPVTSLPEDKYSLISTDQLDFKLVLKNLYPDSE